MKFTNKGIRMIENVALTLDFIGKILVGLRVLFVHRKVSRERRINKYVLKEMKKEQLMAILGIILISFGYVLHLYGVG